MENILSIWDYVVLGLMLLISAAIGTYYRLTGGKQKTASEYLHGDKSMSALPVAFSLMASFMSAITLMGVSQENYTFGTQFVIINFSYFIGTPIVAYFYLPVFFRLQVTSAYEYLEKRFGQVTRIIASMMFSIQMILYMGIVVYAPAIALSAVTGISYSGSILAVGMVCTFYSTIGGMKAVLITDVFQSILMFAAVFGIIICGSINLGGIDEVIKIANERGRLEFFNFNPDPTVRHTFWTQIIGGLFIFLSVYAVNQAQIQRLLSIKDLKQSQMSIWIQWPILVLLSLSTSLAGLTMFAFYKDCDPVLSERIPRRDQLMPLFVVDTMKNYPGMSGLIVSGIFSGSLSTVSSAINSLAAVTLEDYIKLFCQPKNPALILKILVFLYGFICIGLTFLVEFLGTGVLQASLIIFSVVGGPTLGLFTLGMGFTKTNQPGALTGFIFSLIFSFWIGFGKPKPKPTPLSLSISECSNYMNLNTTLSTISDENKDFFYLYRISYAWYALMGFVICLVIGLLVSIIVDKIFLKKNQKLNPNLFVTWIQRRLEKNDENKEVISLNIKQDHSVEKSNV